MAIEVRSYLYEVLLRFGPEGLTGAHSVHLEEVVNDGTVLAQKDLGAQPVELEDIDTVLGEQLSNLVTQNAALTARVAELEAAQGGGE